MRIKPMNSLLVLLFLIYLVCAGCYVSYDNSSKFRTETHGDVLKELPKIPEAEKPFDYPYSEGVDHQNCKFDDMMF
ncbi:MAG: hypothetical protein LBP59_06175 [Planctomycetaceae bacterium]|nr:hypothetical protein [Planctomycetaceae bacterium]